MLGTCVFIWGFAYKLSLYDTHRPTLHRIPEAKLLSKNEDPNATDSLRLCLQNALSFQSLLLGSAASIGFSLPGAFRPACRSFLQRMNIPRPQSKVILTAFLFRPPPIRSVL
jgi:hypothetical protein